MANFTNSTLRLLRRLLGPAPRETGPYAGAATVLDGNSAIAITEASSAECAALGATFPADAAALAWRVEQDRHRINSVGGLLDSFQANSPRGAIAAATGMALAGTRASCFIAAPDLAANVDLLNSAAGRHLPLVVQVVNRALPRHSATLGSGHEALHMAADAGCFILVAATVQEAVDFTLIARCVAEQTLTPGLVVIDGGETAIAIQEVKLAPPGLIRELIGRAADTIQTPTSTQQLIFGETRRRVPCWHNPDRPVMLGGVEAPATWGLGSAAQQIFYHSHSLTSLHETFSRFEQLTGRHYHPLSTHHMHNSELVLVAEGATVETLQAVANHLHKSIKVGVIGIRQLRPFPAAEVAGLLVQGRRICVLERLDSPLGGDPPLMREIRAALARALDNQAKHNPRLDERQLPKLLSVVYGLGGLPLRAADLIELCRQADKIERSKVYLGMNFMPDRSQYPKRQVLLDRLRRVHPEIAELGLAATDLAPDLKPNGAIGVAVHRLSGTRGDGLIGEVAQLLHQVLKGRVRARPALHAEPWGALSIDRIYSGDEHLLDGGDDMPVDVAVVTAPANIAGFDPGAGLAPNGVVLLASPLDHDALWQTLPNAVQQQLQIRKFSLYHLPLTGPGDNEYLLGGLAAVLLEHELIGSSARRLIGARESLLKHSIASVEQAMERFKQGMARIERMAINDIPLNAPATEGEAPTVLRELGPSDDGYDSLPRFWDQVGVLHHQGTIAELTPDPYLALGAMPPLSAGFRDLSPLRTKMPAYNPALCTGCGTCWSICPDAAIGVRLFTPRKLLETAMRKGGGEALSPVVAKLAKQMNTICDAAASIAADALIEQSFDKMRDSVPADRAEAIDSAINSVRAVLGPMPLATTDAFYRNRVPSELLMLAINPDACKSCAVCISNCSTGALSSTPQDQALVEDYRRKWKKLPWFTGATPAAIEQAAAQPDVSALAAALLAQRPTASLNGSDGAEPGSGARIAVRQVLAAAEARLAAPHQQWLDQVRSARDGIAEQIREALAAALPADDLEALSQGLATVETRQAELHALIGTAEQNIDKTIDTARLRRLVTLAQQLGTLFEQLDSGRQGLGRARLGVVLTSGIARGWSGTFPYNPFAQPVTVDLTGDGAALAAGLLDGQLRRAAADFAVLRKARLELKNPAEAARSWVDLEQLGWRDLTPEERAMCPQLLLIGGADVLAVRGLAQLFQLLGTDLPLRIMVLADLDLGLAPLSGLDSAVATVADSGIKLGLLALAQRRALVAQSSIAAADHLLASCEAAFDYHGPALLHLHAPSPSRHGFSTRQTIARAAQATASRLFPLFRYDPTAEGVFGMRLSLDGNPSPQAIWSDDPIMTPADWAIGEQRFADYFTPVEPDAPDTITVADYLALAATQRGNKIPIIAMAGHGEQPKLYRVDPCLIAVCEQQRDAWRTLQELAGVITPFTARVQAEAKQAVAAEREAELAALTRRHEQQMEQLRNDLYADVRHEVQARLMMLAGYQQPNSTGRVD